MDYLQQIANSLDYVIKKRGSKYLLNKGYYSVGYECDNLNQVARILADKIKELK